MFLLLSVGLSAAAGSAPCSILNPDTVQQVFDFHSRCALVLLSFRLIRPSARIVSAQSLRPCPAVVLPAPGNSFFSRVLAYVA